MIYFAANLPRLSLLTQGTVRRAIPIRGEQPTLDAVRQSVKTASAEVVNMHFQMTRQLEIRPKEANTREPRMQSSQTQQRFLDDALNANREWIKSTRPGHVLPLLRAVAAERLLQHAAELEVATVAAASNLLFRACVKQKVQKIRSLHFERKARLLAQERERQRLLEESRLLEERRWEAWLGA